jgi:hypothetical protein
MVQKIKLLESKRYEGSQDLEIISRYLDEVEPYVCQGTSICPKASAANQYIDSFCRLHSVTIFWWFEKESKRMEMEVVPLADNDYKVKWADNMKVFKQSVPEVVVSVVRNNWRALKF